MGEWKGNPRKQIIQKIIKLFQEDPDFVPEHLTRPKLGISGMIKPEFSSVAHVDNAAKFLQETNKVNKKLRKKIIHSKEQLKGLREFGVEEELGGIYREGLKGFKQSLDEANKQRNEIKKITAKIITDVGGSGEIRRQRRDIEKAVRVMQKKRPFDN